MFREMRRTKQQVTEEKCREILKEEKRAVLSLSGDDGYPYGLPVNFYYDENENVIYLHGAMSGHKIDAIKKNDKVCFTVWDQGYLTHDDWAYNVTSVIAFGRAELITDVKKATEKVRLLGYRYYPEKEAVEEEIRESMHHTQIIAINIEHMTGKLVNEK